MNLHDALTAANIPLPPPNVRSVGGGFLRYGKGNRYWQKRLDGVVLFGDWVTGKSHYWFEDSHKLDAEQLAACKAKLAQLRQEHETERTRLYYVRAARCEQVWKMMSEAGNSQYLERKKILAFGLRYRNNTLLVPLRDTDGKLWSFQSIQNDGSKRFFAGGRKRGCFHAIGQLGDSVFIAEGYATAASIHMATGATVVVAFDAGNLGPVVQALRAKYPTMRITIAADNDCWKPESGNIGKEKAEAVAAKYGCTVLLPAFKDVSTEPTDFNDLAMLEGLETVKAQLVHIEDVKVVQPTAAHSSYRLVRDDARLRDGVYYFGKNNDDEDMPPLWICSPLEITARTNDGQGQGWGYLLEWSDPDGRHHSWPMPSEMLAGMGDEYRRALLDGGLQIASGGKAKGHLTHYIQCANTDVRVRCTDKTGWHNGVFVLPSGTLGSTKERVLYQSGTIQRHAFQQRGTLEEWRNSIALPSQGNSRMLFALSCAFAPVLLELIGEESGGFHFRGESSSGKTTLLRLAASVWGSHEYLQRWRATTNGLEGLAQLHNDCLLILDELAQVEPKEAGEIAYMLGNGSGKVRSSREGLARKAARWRLLYLSAGEIGLADHVRLGGREVRAGQEIRLADIPADAGKGLGAFEVLHQWNNPAVFARALNDSAGKHYGSAGIAFLGHLISNLPKLPEMIAEHRRDFMQTVIPPQSSGQVERVAARFALVAFAGELASHFDITGWAKGEAEHAVKACFNAWMATRGGAGNLETQKLLSDIRAQLEAHGESRFTLIGTNDGRPTINRMGFIRMEEGKRQYIVLPEVFKRELCKGHDVVKATKVLLALGILVHDSSGAPQKRESLPEMGRIRCYVLLASKLWEDVHGT